jgi:hypothetical protein
MSMGFYMGGHSYAGAPVTPSGVGVRSREGASQNVAMADGPQLRSEREVTGYHIHASDGEIGQVADFLIEDGDWSIHYLILDMGGWWPGKTVLVSPRSVLKTNWSDHTVIPTL